jgi:hypothetical protein
VASSLRGLVDRSNDRQWVSGERGEQYQGSPGLVSAHRIVVPGHDPGDIGVDGVTVRPVVCVSGCLDDSCQSVGVVASGHSFAAVDREASFWVRTDCLGVGAGSWEQAFAAGRLAGPGNAGVALDRTRYLPRIGGRPVMIVARLGILELHGSGCR